MSKKNDAFGMLFTRSDITDLNNWFFIPFSQSSPITGKNRNKQNSDFIQHPTDKQRVTICRWRGTATRKQDHPLKGSRQENILYRSKRFSFLVRLTIRFFSFLSFYPICYYRQLFQLLSVGDQPETTSSCGASYGSPAPPVKMGSS